MRFSLALSAILLAAFSTLFGQNAALTGTVTDSSGAVVPNATVKLTQVDTQLAQETRSNNEGIFEFPVLRPGAYSLRIEASGFKTFVRRDLPLAVDQRGRVDATLELGESSAVVNVEATAQGVQSESSSLGEVVETKKIVEIPLNGRFFLDLALLTPGTVVPSTNNRTFLASPSGIGSSGINAAGAREDSTNYLFDGVNLSDMVQNQITFQPNIDMIREFKVQTNSFSAEYGRNAGIIVNAVSKSGTNGFHGSAFEFLRNEKLDAKNFFDSPTQPIAPFKRNIFGYSIGGPILRNKTFFFHSYEGRQGRESVSLRTPVPSAGQRASATNPVIQKLLTLVPEANSPGNFFVGSVPKKRELNQFTGRVDHSFNERHLIGGTFISNRDSRTEPNLQGGNLPGAGDSRPARRYLLSLSYTAVLSPTLTNEARAGLNRVKISFNPETAELNPSAFGMNTGSGVLPRIAVAGGMAFGGINGFPQGRGDTTFQYNDTLSWIRGRHSFRFGGEFRKFLNNNFNGGTGGVISFATIDDFINARSNQTTQQQVAANPALAVNALNLFAQDDYKVNSRLTLNIGLRWEVNGAPSERYNRLAAFDFASKTIKQIGSGIDRPYPRDTNNFGPRFGFAYDPTGKGKMVIRAAAGLYYDQPVTNIVTGLGSNPPFAGAVTFTSTPQRPLNIDLASPFNLPGGGPTIFNVNAIDPFFKSGRVFQYNFNVQRELLGTVFQATYVGSQGRNLRIIRDANQGVNSVRPLPAFGQINLNEATSRSHYNALWVSANRSFRKGLTFTTSYTFSKSIDLNSVGSSNPQIQDSYNVNAEHALSDFDARHRYVASLVYQLPFTANSGFAKRLVEGWSISPIANLQAGNPFSPIVTLLNSGSLLQFDRPDYVPGQALYTSKPDPAGFVNRAAFTANQRGQFGNVGRNTLKAPGFQNFDFSLAKNTTIREGIGLQFRAEVFNIGNHPNLGQPVNVVNNSLFGQITATRTVRGDLGSSRQIQLGMKLLF